MLRSGTPAPGMSDSSHRTLTAEPLHILGALALGGIGGFTSVALGLVGVALVVLLTPLTVIWLRRRLVAMGVYFVFLGAAAIAILLPVVSGSQPCQGSWNGSVTSSANCYAPSTVPALAGYSVVMLLGLAIAGYAIRSQSRGSSSSR